MTNKTTPINEAPIATAVKEYGPYATFRELDSIIKTHLLPGWIDELNRYWQQEIARAVREEVKQVGAIVVKLELPEDVLVYIRQQIYKAQKNSTECLTPSNSAS